LRSYSRLRARFWGTSRFRKSATPVNGGGGGRVVVVVLSAEVVVGVAVRIGVVSDDGLLPSLDEVKNISGDKNLKAEDPIHKLEPLTLKTGPTTAPSALSPPLSAFPTNTPFPLRVSP
jgi:hypothetical protein